MKLNILGVPTIVKRTVLEEGFSGMFIPDENVILIDKALEGKDYYTVLAHEIVHSVLARCGATQVITPEIEEVLCECLSHVFVDNSHLLFYSPLNEQHEKRTLGASKKRSRVGKRKK